MSPTLGVDGMSAMDFVLVCVALLIAGGLAEASLRYYRLTRLLKRSDPKRAPRHEPLTPRARAELRFLVGLAADQDPEPSVVFRARTTGRLPHLVSAGLTTGIVVVVGLGLAVAAVRFWGRDSQVTPAATSVVSTATRQSSVDRTSNPPTTTTSPSVPPAETVNPAPAVGDSGGDPAADPTAAVVNLPSAVATTPAAPVAPTVPPVTLPESLADQLAGQWLAHCGDNAWALPYPVTLEQEAPDAAGGVFGQVDFGDNDNSWAFPVTYTALANGTWDFSNGSTQPWTCPDENAPDSDNFTAIFTGLAQASRWQLSSDNNQLTFTDSAGVVRATFDRV